MLNRIRTEPALVTGLIRAVLLCLVAFGFKLDPGQIAAVMLVAEAGLSLLTRSQVTPTVNVPQAEPYEPEEDPDYDEATGS